MNGLHQQQNDYQTIERAIQWLDLHARENPTPGALADELGLSSSHMQRLFQRWAGLSSDQVLEFLTVKSGKAWLDRSASVLDAAFAAGLSGPGRLPDHRVLVEAVSPGEYKRGGAGVTIRYGTHESPFGPCLLGVTERGISYFGFGEGLQNDLQLRWPNAHLIQDVYRTGETVRDIFHPLESTPPMRLYLRGTNFQVKVWEAISHIPAGSVASYGDLARRMGRPSSGRAVGAAVGANLVAYLIPCHRVLQASGALYNYRWGAARKRAILVHEFTFGS